MIVIPAIDLSDGACVRLYRGEFSKKTIYSHDPLETALRFREAGAEWLHVVDLDGARSGEAAQTEVVVALARESGLRVEAGGGIRTAHQIDMLLSRGVARVVIGSRAADAPTNVRTWLRAFGSDRLVLAFDVRTRNDVPFPATRGWRVDSDRSLWDVLSEYDRSGLRHVLCTDIERDGTLEEPNLDLYREFLLRSPGLDVLASGGVSALADLRALKRTGVAGAIVGKALYEEKFQLAEALRC